MAKCYCSFASTAFLMFVLIQQCCLLLQVNGDDVVVTTNTTLLGASAPDRRVYFPDEIVAKLVEYEDFIDPISGEDEDDESREIADVGSVSMSATEITEEDLSGTPDTVNSYVVFPSSVEKASH